MKIGLDISQIVYQTGVSRYTAELVEAMLAQNQSNHFHLYGASLRQRPTLKAFIAKFKSSSVSSQLPWLSPKLLDIFWNQLNLCPLDSGQNLDIFHASNWALPKVKCKLITTIHDLTFITRPQDHTAYSVKVHTRHLKRAKKLADMIITDSNSSKNDLINFGINPDKIKVIYLAPSKMFQPETNNEKIKAILDQYQIKTPFILSVGTHEPRKNLARLIQAYSGLNLKSTQLVIVGKFGWGDQVKPVPGVKLLGFIPDADLKVLYSSAKLFVYPSLYEGFGLPILEAFSCGCPVISSNLASLPELGGDAAVYINPLSTKDLSKAIKQLLQSNDSNYQTMKQNSLEQAKKFSWEKTARQTLAVYQEVIKC